MDVIGRGFAHVGFGLGLEILVLVLVIVQSLSLYSCQWYYHVQLTISHKLKANSQFFKLTCHVRWTRQWWQWWQCVKWLQLKFIQYQVTALWCIQMNDMTPLAVWRNGNGVRWRINEVTPRQARLVLGRVTNLTNKYFIKPPRPNQPPTSAGREMSTSQSATRSAAGEVKAGTAHSTCG